MTSSMTDRRSGFSSSLAFKAPCRVASTGNLTLSGYQTIDGVLPTSSNSASRRRVLVKDQTDASENGIYVMDTGPWERAKDFDSNTDFTQGTLIPVNDGTVNANTIWAVTNTNDTIVVGTTSLTFDQYIGTDSANLSYAQAGTGAVSRTVSDRLRERISVLDFIPTSLHAAILAGTSTTDVSSYINLAYDYAATVGGNVFFPAGRYYCTSDIDLPVGHPCPDTYGTGYDSCKILFSGTGVTHGMYAAGNSSTYPYMGSIRDLRIDCQSGAARGITAYGVDTPRIERVCVFSAAGAGIYLDYALVSKLEHCLIGACGSASEGQVVVDNSTTFFWSHCYISGSNGSTASGLMIDRTLQVTVIGGAIESTGIPIKIGSKSEGTYSTDNGIIMGVDLENPGTHYIEMGYGWTGTAQIGVRNWNIINVNGFVSGATAIDYGAKLKNTIGITFDNVNLNLTGTPIASFWLQDSTNSGTIVRTSRYSFGNSYPWVMTGGYTVSTAHPLYDWNSGDPKSINATKTIADGGATPSFLLDAQGGTPKYIKFSNSVAQTVNNLATGAMTAGVEIIIQALDANTTLAHSANADDGAFILRGGTNLTLQTNEFYHFISDGQYWYEVGNNVTSGSARTFHTGNSPSKAATDGNDTAPVVGTSYIAEIFVPASVRATGIAITNGSSVAGNVTVGIANSTGSVLAYSSTSGTAVSGAAGMQRIPFTASYALRGPATYYAVATFTSTDNRFRTHAIGNFGTLTTTGITLGSTSLNSFSAPTTFASSAGPIASLY